MDREDGGQKVVNGFMVNGVVLYTKAPGGEEGGCWSGSRGVRGGRWEMGGGWMGGRRGKGGWVDLHVYGGVCERGLATIG